MDTPVQTETPRCTASLSLREDLVQRANALTDDLSRTVEKLISAWASREEANREHPEALAESIARLDALHEREGFLSDEFPSI